MARDFEDHCWKDVIDADTIQIYQAYRRKIYVGDNPAVLAIDQLHRLLRQVGKRQLSDERFLDEAGKLRVIFRTPNWEDFVNLAFSEIRRCGADNFQVSNVLAKRSSTMMVLPVDIRGDTTTH